MPLIFEKKSGDVKRLLSELLFWPLEKESWNENSELDCAEGFVKVGLANVGLKLAKEFTTKGWLELFTVVGKLADL